MTTTFEPVPCVRLHGNVTVENLVTEGIPADSAEVLLAAPVLEVKDARQFHAFVADPRGGRWEGVSWSLRWDLVRAAGGHPNG